MAVVPGNIKCLIIFSSGTGYGWTETHYLSNSSNAPNLSGALTTLNQLCAIRAPILGTGHTIVGTRVSAKAGNVIASLDGVPGGTGNPAQPATSQNDSLACQMIDSTLTRKKIIHLRGIWNSVVGGEGYLANPPAAPNYDTLVVNYLNALTKPPFGWNGSSAAAKVFGSVTGWTVNAGGTLTFTLVLDPNSAVPATLPQLNTLNPVSVRFSKINYSHSVLNRTFVCTVNQTLVAPIVLTCTTVGPVATGPFIASGRFSITTPAFIPYVNIGKRSLGERRMGKVLGLYPGRSRRKAVN
jgi:hypothetical protein